VRVTGFLRRRFPMWATDTNAPAIGSFSKGAGRRMLPETGWSKQPAHREFDRVGWCRRKTTNSVRCQRH